jgi:hypothetical protein
LETVGRNTPEDVVRSRRILRAGAYLASFDSRRGHMFRWRAAWKRSLRTVLASAGSLEYPDYSIIAEWYIGKGNRDKALMFTSMALEGARRAVSRGSRGASIFALGHIYVLRALAFLTGDSDPKNPRARTALNQARELANDILNEFLKSKRSSLRDFIRFKEGVARVHERFGETQYAYSHLCEAYEYVRDSVSPDLKRRLERHMDRVNPR